MVEAANAGTATAAAAAAVVQKTLKFQFVFANYHSIAVAASFEEMALLRPLYYVGFSSDLAARFLRNKLEKEERAKVTKAHKAIYSI